MNIQSYIFLNSARVLHWEWLSLKAKHDELESCLLPVGIRYDRDKVQTSPTDPMAKIVAEVMELEKEMNRVQMNRAKQIEKISKAISALKCAEERTALSMRYINGISVKEIAITMKYSEKRIYQFMDRGGAQIAKGLKD